MHMRHGLVEKMSYPSRRALADSQKSRRLCASTSSPTGATMRHGAAARAIALLAAALAALAAQPAAAAAKPMTQKACEALCKASVAACAAAEAAGARDAAVVAAAARGAGCRPWVGAARSPRCKDLALLVLDAISYEESPNGAASPEQTACTAFAGVCVPWCANDRQQVPVTIGPPRRRAPSPLPLAGNTTGLVSAFALGTRGPERDRLGGFAFEITHVERPAGTRTRLHYHKSVAATCVLDGCVRVRVSGGPPEDKCAVAGGLPNCYLMPAYREILNENAFGRPTKLVDFFARGPGEERLYPLE
jgi:hypothetical protein